MNIVQISTRVSEGGAARIARNLHELALNENWNSIYLYGYSRGGKHSPLENVVPRIRMISSRSRSALNYLLFKLINRDIVGPNKKVSKEIGRLFKTADVIHVHGLHSHFFPLKDFFRLAELGRAKIVFTLHDYWMMTGRCAFVEECDGWIRGCGNCLKLSNYPKVLIDRSRKEWQYKRDLINKYRERISVLAPAKHIARSYGQAFPSECSATVIRNCCSDEYHMLEFCASPEGVMKKIALVCADFQDSGKYSLNDVSELSKSSDSEFYLIGKNSDVFSAHLKSSKSFGEVRSAGKLAKILSECSHYLFLSKKDIYPLALIEAVSLGLKPLAVQSAAAQEVLSETGDSCFANVNAIKNFLSSENKESISTIIERRSMARKAFSQEAFWVMHKNYYRDILI